MRDKVLRYIRENDLILSGSTLVCAVSGGKDSVCLLHLMLSLQDELQIRVEAAHLNHQLRGAESDRDEAFVRKLCKTLGVPLTVSRADVSGRCKATGESMEEAARVLRYQFFERLGKPVATAHTMDDNLETVLLNLIRGTALRGLCGIPSKRGALIRPMLCVSREEIEQYLTEHGLSHVEDTSNASDLPRRNRLRHEVVPLLKRENPSLCETVFHMDQILRQEDDYLDAQAASLLAASKTDAGWSCRVLRSAPQAVCARAMRTILRELSISKPSRAHVDALMQLIGTQNGTQTLTLPGVKTLVRAYDTLAVQDTSLPQTFLTQKLLPDSAIYISELQLRISCQFVKKYQKTANSLCTFALKCDTIPVTDALYVRPRQTGDTIRLPGGRKSLKKLLIDRKVPAQKRLLVPVVSDEQGVILAYPYAADQTRAAQPGETALLIHFAHEKEYIQKEDTR